MTPYGTTHGISHIFGFLDLFGPIFSKELRTSARQKRNYALRSVYVLILTIVVMLVWYASTAHMPRNPIYGMAQMSRVGVELLAVIGFVQFIAFQLISPVLTCTAISDEINHNTLGGLMMTPISAMQIVTGKLFSRLLTMVLLVSTSLPLLAIIRVFGGIEWSLVLAIVALTLCSALFSAAVSLTYSIFHRKAYAAIIMTYISLLTVYLLIPLMLTAAENRLRSSQTIPKFFQVINPFASMIVIMEQAFNPIRGVMPGTSPYPGLLAPHIQCIMLLSGTFILVVFCSALVRRIALRLAAGEAAMPSFPELFDKSNLISVTIVDENTGKTESHDLDVADCRPPRPVSDHPVLWKEIHSPIMGTPKRQLILILFTAGALAWTYVHTWRGNAREEFHTLYTVTFKLISLVGAAIYSAITITGEKEASTLEALLTTPLTARDIVYGKALGVVKRLWAVFALFFIHIAFFTMLGKVHPLALLYMLLLLPAPIFFLIGLGTFITAHVKRTTTAVVLNLAAALVLWAVLPLFAGLLGEIFYDHRHFLAEGTLLFNPFVLDAVCFHTLCDWHVYGSPVDTLVFDLPVSLKLGQAAFATLLAGISACYVFLGTFFLESAVWRISRLRS